MEKNKQSQKKNETPKRKKSQRVSLAPILKKKTIQLKIKISKGNELTQKDTNESKI